LIGFSPPKNKRKKERRGNLPEISAPRHSPPLFLDLEKTLIGDVAQNYIKLAPNF